ncbi:hypothetical protein Tco_1410533 [Tanacetum coccineum]
MGSWNVGSLTGKLFELADILGRHKVEIACFQENKWKRVGVILADGLNDKVVQVTRSRDRIMANSVVIDEETNNWKDTRGFTKALAMEIGMRKSRKETLELARNAWSFSVRRVNHNIDWGAAETLRASVLEGLSALVEESDVDQMYNTLARFIREAAKDSLGVASGLEVKLLGLEERPHLQSLALDHNPSSNPIFLSVGSCTRTFHQSNERGFPAWPK